MDTYFKLKTWSEFIIPVGIVIIAFIIVVFISIYTMIYDKIQAVAIRRLIAAFKKKGYAIRAVRSYGCLPHKYLVKDLGDGERFKYIFLHDLEKKTISEIKKIINLEKAEIGYYSDRQMKFIDEE